SAKILGPIAIRWRSRSPFTLPRRSRYQGLHALCACALRSSSLPDCLRCGVLRRSRAIPPDQPEHDMSPITQSTVLEPLVGDAKGEYRPGTGDEILAAAREVIGRSFTGAAQGISPCAQRDGDLNGWLAPLSAVEACQDQPVLRHCYATPLGLL